MLCFSFSYFWVFTISPSPLRSRLLWEEMSAAFSHLTTGARPSVSTVGDAPTFTAVGVSHLHGSRLHGTSLLPPSSSDPYMDSNLPAATVPPPHILSRPHSTIIQTTALHNTTTSSMSSVGVSFHGAASSFAVTECCFSNFKVYLQPLPSHAPLPSQLSHHGPGFSRESSLTRFLKVCGYTRADSTEKSFSKISDKFGYPRPIFSDTGVRGSLQGQQSSSVLVRFFMGIRGSRRWQQSSSDSASSDDYALGYLRPVSSGSGVRGSLQWPQSSSALVRHHLGVRGSRRWQQSSSDNPTFSGMENVFKRSSRMASRAISFVRSPLMAKELKIVYTSIFLEALLKKLPVFISDVYRLTYQLNALFLIYVSSVLISLAKSPPLVILS